MKTSHLLVAMILVCCLSSCNGRQDPLLGRWSVEKVNVEFNEDRATPEMVRQVGALEKDNLLQIDADSLLTLVSDGDTLRGRCSLRGGQLFLDGKPLGTFKQGRIRTLTTTPLGTVEVLYRKER
ncbi:MAG: hypothetical protein J6X40_07995 [Bacteroidales bacterium]|nr:hypothetical protein [Bacteroidales bacterium]